MVKNNIDAVSEDVKFVKSIYLRVLKKLPSFDIVNAVHLPYGLKANTRSVSWITEQVITQKTKTEEKFLGLTNVKFNMIDTSLHNSEIFVGEKKYFVNIKIRDLDKKPNSSDIASVKKLYEQYKNDPEYSLIYACFGIHFDNLTIRIDPDYLKVFSPQFLPIQVNKSIKKIQANYNHVPILRTREEFLSLLAQ